MVKLTFLGTGTSNGIPVIGCPCEVCSSADPRDNRTRTSALVQWDDLAILVDTATELRLQARAAKLDHLDAVVFTHAHADHTGGFDDLRRFNEISARHLPVYASPETAAIFRHRFAYAFEDIFPFYGGKPDLTLNEIDGPFTIGDKEIVPIPVEHGRTPVLGFRFGPLAYVTDAKVIPDSSLDLMRGCDILVLNALRDRPHPTHLCISEAVKVVMKVQPRVAYLVHLSHEISHQTATALLPEGIFIAYDGLQVCTSDRVPNQEHPH